MPEPLSSPEYFKQHRAPPLSAAKIRSGVGATTSQLESVRATIKQLGLPLEPRTAGVAKKSAKKAVGKPSTTKLAPKKKKALHPIGKNAAGSAGMKASRSTGHRTSSAATKKASASRVAAKGRSTTRALRTLK